MRQQVKVLCRLLNIYNKLLNAHQKIKIIVVDQCKLI